MSTHGKVLCVSVCLYNLWRLPIYTIVPHAKCWKTVTFMMLTFRSWWWSAAPGIFFSYFFFSPCVRVGWLWNWSHCITQRDVWGLWAVLSTDLDLLRGKTFFPCCRLGQWSLLWCCCGGGCKAMATTKMLESTGLTSNGELTPVWDRMVVGAPGASREQMKGKGWAELRPNMSSCEQCRVMGRSKSQIVAWSVWPWDWGWIL